MLHTKYRTHFTWVIPSYSSEQLDSMRATLRGISPHKKKESRKTPARLTIVPLATFAIEVSQNLHQCWSQLMEMPGFLPLHPLSGIGVVIVMKPATVGPAHSWRQRAATVCGDTDLSWWSCTELCCCTFPGRDNCTLEYADIHTNASETWKSRIHNTTK